ncbi:MAG: ABC transporter ATP-binding protein/permease [Gordonia sp. (in: high G+C Gram-positive bacteria)]|nr:ABC transporter ATP-binding protein/permease [Gordonia sp. (in: high G+C Gram-positive bacteria)]
MTGEQAEQRRTWAIVSLAGQAVASRKALTVGVLIAQLVAMAAGLAQPAFNARIVDAGVIAGDVDYVQRMGAMMIGVVVIGLVASMAAVACGSAIAAGVSADLRLAVYRRAGELSTADYHELGTASMLTRTSADTGVVGRTVFAFTSVALSAPIVTVGAVVLSLRQSVQLAPVIVVTAILLGVVVGLYVARVTPLAGRLQRAVDAVNRVLREQLTGTRILRTFRREQTASDRFGIANTELTSLARRVGALQVLLLPSVLLIANLAVVATNVIGADLIESDDLTIGGLTAFTGYLMQIVSGVSLFVAMAAVLPRAEASAIRLREVLHEDVPDPGPADIADRPFGVLALDFRSVDVRYDGADQLTLDAVTLRCVPGGVTAVIGGTSSGKSTLLSLVPRLLDASGGEVALGDRRIGSWPVAAVRSEVAYVGQRHALIAGTVASNLRLAYDDAPDELVWKALRVTKMADTVRDRGGLDTAVSQGGSNFSGGQRQRLAIARALLHRPRVLVLDDAFSAMDRSTAAEVFASVRAHLPRTTFLVAAQQIHSVRNADLIAVLELGRLVDQGSHHELLARCGVYREIADAQTSARAR